MIIDQCRKLALRAPPRVVFPDALDVRVLKAAHYLQQQGLAHPILVASPFALRQFALGERLPLTGVQVIDPHSNLAMREAFAAAWQARAGDKAPADAVDKLADPLMFAAAMVSAGQAEVCIAGNLSSTASVLRAGLRLIGLQPGCKTLSSLFLMLPQYAGQPLGFADCSVVPQPTAAQLADIIIAPQTGPEAVAGLANPKAQLAQRQIVNMLTTGLAIRDGRVYSNLRVDVQADNSHWAERQIAIVMAATDCTRSEA
ncbi:hypothetical protein LUD45_15980, partial [Klebsiella pneumoniae]|nr:hypothetical protein [Klebsiella pneumoniae]